MAYLVHSAYHHTAFRPVELKKTVERVAKKVKTLKKKLKFDAIAFRGISGSCVAFPVSYLTGIPLICVRKEKNHHGNTVEGPAQDVMKYIIIDDFICTGDTLEAIIKKISGSKEEGAKCVGIVLYDLSYDPESYTRGGKNIKVYRV